MARSSTVSISPCTWSKNCVTWRRWAGPSTPGRGQVVDEEAVALVGRDAAGARVRLDQIALALERDHLGAHGGRGDLHPRCVGHVGGADRLGRADVLGHHRLEDGGAPGVERGVPEVVAMRGGVGVGRHGRSGTQVYRVPGARPRAGTSDSPCPACGTGQTDFRLTEQLFCTCSPRKWRTGCHRNSSDRVCPEQPGLRTGLQNAPSEISSRHPGAAPR